MSIKVKETLEEGTIYCYSNISSTYITLIKYEDK